MKIVTSQDYRKLLDPWLDSADRYIFDPFGDGKSLCFGTGESANWPIQTTCNAFTAFSVGAYLNRDSSRGENLFDIAHRLLNYILTAHISGDGKCVDGKSWGHTWIAVLAIERMMTGVEAYRQYMTPGEESRLKEMLRAECDWLVDGYEVVAGIEAERNKPESNIWNGCMLCRTALCFPDLPRRSEYLEKATVFFVNGISVPADAHNGTVYGGKPVKDWFVGPNFTENYSLNHHGYLNVGYMVICMSNIAMLHFGLKKRGLEIPPELYHHVEDLWEKLKHFVFADGRLLRIGGDTRVRYCYCQDYAIPMWMLMIDGFDRGECCGMEAGWLDQLQKECAANTDGLFLSGRLETMALNSPFYYTRLEGDRAATVAFGAYWHDCFEMRCDPSLPARTEEYAWKDDFHGAALRTDPGRVTSFVWSGGMGPTAVCVPPDGSDMAEWRRNLAGEVRSPHGGRLTVDKKAVRLFDGGFLSLGRMTISYPAPLGEGEPESRPAIQYLAFVALPDGRSSVVLQRVVALRHWVAGGFRPVSFKIPNDLFNDFERTVYHGSGSECLKALPARDEIRKTGSRWMNIDERIGLINLQASGFEIHRTARRNVGVGHEDFLMPGLYAEEICAETCPVTRCVGPGDVLFDAGALVCPSMSADETRLLSESGTFQLDSTNAGVLKATLAGVDNRGYVVSVNMTGEEACATLEGGPDPVSVALQ